MSEELKSKKAIIHIEGVYKMLVAMIGLFGVIFAAIYGGQKYGVLPKPNCDKCQFVNIWEEYTLMKVYHYCTIESIDENDNMKITISDLEGQSIIEAQGRKISDQLIEITSGRIADEYHLYYKKEFKRMLEKLRRTNAGRSGHTEEQINFIESEGFISEILGGNVKLMNNCSKIKFEIFDSSGGKQLRSFIKKQLDTKIDEEKEQ